MDDEKKGGKRVEDLFGLGMGKGVTGFALTLVLI
jgi:hypothetical protein